MGGSGRKNSATIKRERDEERQGARRRVERVERVEVVRVRLAQLSR
jgi:hypothetical protein